MGGAVSSIFGISKPKVNPVSAAPAAAIDAEKKKNKTLRTALLSTEGGVSGVDLTPGQVSKRDTIFGN